MAIFHQGMALFPSHTLRTQFLEPVFGVILAVILLKEEFGASQWIGMTIIIISLVLMHEHD